MPETKLRGRTLSRAQAVQLLFQAEHNHTSVDEVLASSYLVTQGPATPYAIELAKGAENNKEHYSALLAKTIDNWDITRVANVDMQIMLVALYELYAVSDVDISVAISEAVELAKLFGGDDSYRFVNGVLGSLSKLSAHTKTNKTQSSTS